MNDETTTIREHYRRTVGLNGCLKALCTAVPERGLSAQLICTAGELLYALQLLSKILNALTIHL